MSKLVVLVVSFVFVALIAASCTQPAEQPPTPAAAPVAKAHAPKTPAASPVAGAPVQAADVKGAMAKLASTEARIEIKVNGKSMGVMERKGGNFRMETPPMPGKKIAYIFNATEKKVIMLMIDQKTAMVMPQMKSSDVSRNAPENIAGAESGVTWKKSADGKYWEGTSSDGKRTMKIWLDGPGGLPSKVETDEGVQRNVTEWTYVKVGGIPDSDFTVPKDFKISSMPGMPGMKMPTRLKK